MHEVVAERVIYAAPLFTAPHIIGKTAAPPSDAEPTSLAGQRSQAALHKWRAAAQEWLSHFTYAPWVVANLHLTGLPDGTARCDNVLYGAPGLGYTLSHLQSHSPTVDAARKMVSSWLRRGTLFGGAGSRGSRGGRGSSGGAVLTYYRALTEDPPAVARRRLLSTSWSKWCDDILTELSDPHPNLRAMTTRFDVRLLGHAMVRPTPGLLFGPARAAAASDRPLGRVHFAHSDLSALPLFEEAVYWGTRVAAEVALAL